MSKIINACVRGIHHRAKKLREISCTLAYSGPSQLSRDLESIAKNLEFYADSIQKATDTQQEELLAEAKSCVGSTLKTLLDRARMS